ncbi:GH15 family glucan-1,4-alpha-glucosidase [Motilibacter rhizosphaerae]|uniref:Trehalase n=2 Tax=Motilibacter rhizosphaerae TaxID=598652 RepID=A0A4Q7NVU8_9ACTN|nr:glycoside hydrolase family 15 protein [Motilibacter rhizosphaerae]RZS91008.1 GH15 family glucan-1,4-alpha-glucosidase [Motilibacter rhizosphaerae]
MSRARTSAEATDVAPPATTTASPFPPIGDYGFLSDGEVTALVAPGGAVEWMSVPRMDSASIFGALLGRHAGSFRLGPSDREVPDARRYLPGTMVLETSWGTSSGWVIVRDVLLIGPWRHDRERSATHRRPPTDYDAEHVLLRTVRCVSGEVQVVLDCEPVADYGRERLSWAYTEDGYYQGRAQTGDGVELTLSSDMRLGFEGGRATARTLLKEGDQRFVALSWGEVAPPRTYDEAYERLVWTAHHWQHWLARGTFPDHPWRSFLQRSALTLKGLMYAPTGAVMAAATTSLPETPGGARNYDYRYTWIRDSTFALWALYTLGFDWEGVDFFSFITEVASDDGLQIMYGIGGERELPERELDWLPGYAGARPVRVGNAAYQQNQHDVWGALLDSVYLHGKVHEHLDERIWPLLDRVTQEAMDHWRDPDRGIWEVRGEPQHFVSSKIMCWVALDRSARIARIWGQDEAARTWAAVAEEIRQDVLAHGVDERGALVAHYGTDQLDASVLLAVLVRFLPKGDPRLRATVLAIADELTVDGLVLRYKPESTDDGFEGEEGTFTICSFWLVSALVEIGELERARFLCEKLLSLAGDLQLYAEELDPRTGQHLGNFPQAFTHLALVNAVMHVIRAETQEAP